MRGERLLRTACALLAEAGWIDLDPAQIDAIRYDPEYEHNVQRFTTGIADPDSSEMHEIEDICRQHLGVV